MVTSALPYANGSIHLGHLMEYLFSDIWVRFLKMRGHEAYYFCADDTHGTPVMIRARKENMLPEDLIKKMHAEHVRDFKAFGIEFDNYHSTHSDENQKWSAFVYERLKEKDHLLRRDVEQTFCEHDRVFLPDRLVRGICPRCGAQDQYGDNCEKCNATYETVELKEPRCSICGNPPIRRSTEHIFVKLGDFKDVLLRWIPGALQPEVKNYVTHWIQAGLRDWDISRDGPYFGFPIPGEQNKFFYVWLDAPIGYIASTDNWCKKNRRNVEEFWSDPATEIVHIIGKDIVYFHTLFWPAMLHAAGLNLPSKVHVHGFLRVEGEKMSKSRGTFLNASTYLRFLDPQYLRFYYAAKISAKPDDIDLVFEDFVNRVNAELVNKIVNLYSRNLKFVQSRLASRLTTIHARDLPLLRKATDLADEVASYYEKRDLSAVMLRISQLAEEGNLYLQNTEPWRVLTTNPETASEICTAVANFGLVLAIYLKPVLPALVTSIERIMGVEPLDWSHIPRVVENHTIQPFERLIERMERKQIDELVEASQKEFDSTNQSRPDPVQVDPLSETCSIEDFAKVDLRVAEILEACEVEGADKLLDVKVSLGPLGERRVFAGVREFYPDPAALKGKKVICVANLKPRKMRFGLSEGMLCASSANQDGSHVRVRLIMADPQAEPGDRVS